MSLVNAETGEIVDVLDEAGARDLTDREMFAGLDDRTVAYLRDRLAEHPHLRPALCQAARLRSMKDHRRASSRPPRFVYFIEAQPSGLIKIGSASDPHARLSALQTGSPERLRLIRFMEGGRRLERDLHERFSDSHSHGEWFQPTPALVALAEAKAP